jgi:hypothetical protein
MVPALLAGLPLYALAATRLGLVTHADIAPFLAKPRKGRE